MAAKETKEISPYASALAELEQIILALQEDRIPIQDLGERVARAAVLVQVCKTHLTQTENDIKKLLTL